MKRRKILILVACLSLIGLLSSISWAGHKHNSGPPSHAGIWKYRPPWRWWAPPKHKICPPSKDRVITVLNPLGIQPEIQCYPLAPRVATLENQSIYVVDVKYPGTANFANELTALLMDTYPDVNWVYRQKQGTYFEEDPDLWDEIKAEGAGMIIFVGH
jgi:hypothetical protein